MYDDPDGRWRRHMEEYYRDSGRVPPSVAADPFGEKHPSRPPALNYPLQGASPYHHHAQRQAPPLRRSMAPLAASGASARPLDTARMRTDLMAGAQYAIATWLERLNVGPFHPSERSVWLYPVTQLRLPPRSTYALTYDREGYALPFAALEVDFNADIGGAYWLLEVFYRWAYIWRPDSDPYGDPAKEPWYRISYDEELRPSLEPMLINEQVAWIGQDLPRILLTLGSGKSFD